MFAFPLVPGRRRETVSLSTTRSRPCSAMLAGMVIRSRSSSSLARSYSQERPEGIREILMPTADVCE